MHQAENRVAFRVQYGVLHLISENDRNGLQLQPVAIAMASFLRRPVLDKCTSTASPRGTMLWSTSVPTARTCDAEKSERTRRRVFGQPGCESGKAEKNRSVLVPSSKNAPSSDARSP